jgi:hypothetical protein
MERENFILTQIHNIQVLLFGIVYIEQCVLTQTELADCHSTPRKQDGDKTLVSLTFFGNTFLMCNMMEAFMSKADSSL